MPIRTFRSTAFSPIAPNRVRFIPFTYMAAPVDGPAPAIYIQPVGAPNPPDPVVSFFLSAIGEGDLTYQWQMKLPDMAWVDAVDGATFSGSATAILYVNGVVPSANQVLFRCIVSNDGGLTISNTVSLMGSF